MISLCVACADPHGNADPDPVSPNPIDADLALGGLALQGRHRDRPAGGETAGAPVVTRWPRDAQADRGRNSGAGRCTPAQRAGRERPRPPRPEVCRAPAGRRQDRLARVAAAGIDRTAAAAVRSAIAGRGAAVGRRAPGQRAGRQRLAHGAARSLLGAQHHGRSVPAAHGPRGEVHPGRPALGPAACSQAAGLPVALRRVLLRLPGGRGPAPRDSRALRRLGAARRPGGGALRDAAAGAPCPLHAALCGLAHPGQVGADAQRRRVGAGPAGRRTRRARLELHRRGPRALRVHGQAGRPRPALHARRPPRRKASPATSGGGAPRRRLPSRGRA